MALSWRRRQCGVLPTNRNSNSNKNNTNDNSIPNESTYPLSTTRSSQNVLSFVQFVFVALKFNELMTCNLETYNEYHAPQGENVHKVLSGREIRQTNEKKKTRTKKKINKQTYTENYMWTFRIFQPNVVKLMLKLVINYPYNNGITINQ